MHEPKMLFTYSDAYEATHHIVGTVLSIQHLVLHITCDSGLAPYSELDQVKYQVISVSPALSMQNYERLLDTTMQNRDWKENMIIGGRRRRGCVPRRRKRRD
jgi:hypothetical protein